MSSCSALCYYATKLLDDTASLNVYSPALNVHKNKNKNICSQFLKTIKIENYCQVFMIFSDFRWYSKVDITYRSPNTYVCEENIQDSYQILHIYWEYFLVVCSSWIIQWIWSESVSQHHTFSVCVKLIVSGL